MKPNWLAISLCLNAAMLVLVACVGRRTPERLPTHLVSREITNRSLRLPVTPAENRSVVKELDEPFHWSQLESEDYRVYAANLRAVGCPEATVRNIIVADIRELFLGRVNALVDTVQNQFWDLTANKENFESLIEEKADQLRVMAKERDAILRELLGPSADSPPGQTIAEIERIETSKQLLDFLSPEKIERCLAVDEALERSQRELSAMAPPLKQAELTLKRKALQEQHAQAISQLLTPQELDEYKLRNSRFVDLRFRLPGFEASADELKQIVRLREQHRSESDADAQIKLLLGDERFGGYQRVQDNRYQEFQQVAERFQVSEKAAVEAFEIRRVAEQTIKQFRSVSQLAEGNRLELMKEIRAETERSLAAALGPEAFAVYQRRAGKWLQEMGPAPK